MSSSQPCSPLHILVLSDAPFRDKPGGAHRMVMEIAARLARRGHRVTLAAPRVRPDRPPRETIDGVTIVSYGTGERVRYGPRLVAQARGCIGQLLHDEHVDVVHSHFAFADTGFLTLLSGRSVPLVRSFYGPWAAEGSLEDRPAAAGTVGLARLASLLRYRLRAAAEAASIRRSERLIVLSDYSRRQLIDGCRVAFDKVTLVPGGVDTVRFRPAPDRRLARRVLGLPADGPLLLTVRRLAPRMGLQNLIAAMAAVVQTPAGREARLVIAGQGPLRSALEEQAAAAGLARHVYFAGFVPDEQLPAYYQAADLFVLPSLDLEGFGLILGEALASGVPVIGTPVGAIPEGLGGLDRRLLARDCTVAALSNAVSAYLAEPAACPSAADCRTYAVRRYDWETAVVPAVEAVLRDVAAGRRASTSSASVHHSRA